ncbi:MAG TPA: FecR family protein [Acidobacteriota bacterium]|nr:FecR family protein [Acidobacteriota bacterium]
MTENEHDREHEDVDALHARNVLRGTPPPAPDPEYRARLKAAFAIGAIEHPAEGSPAHEGADRLGPSPLLPPTPIPTPRRRQSALWTGLAAAAAIVIAVLAGVLNRGPEWMLTEVRGQGVVRLDGVPVAASDRESIERLIQPGVQIEVPPGVEVDLMAGRVMAIGLTGGTDLTVPPTPPRWFARRAELHVRSGEIRVSTGPSFPGAQLDVSTPDASIEVTGTTFAVILEPHGTCVCVLEGRVKVGRRDTHDLGEVEAGRLRFVFHDAREPVYDDMRAMERTRLAEFREAQMPLMEKPARD